MANILARVWSELRRLGLAAMQLHNPPSRCHEHSARHAEKQPVFYDAWHIAEPPRQAIGIGNLAKAAVKDVVVLVRYERFSTQLQPHRDLRSECRNPLCNKRLCKLNHFHR